MELSEKLVTVMSEFSQVTADKILPLKEIDLDLGLDSLDQVEFVIALELKYEIEIPEEISEKWSTMEDVQVYLNKYEN